MSNPFDDGNAWSNSGGPVYGSAYENTSNKMASPPLPPRNNQTPSYAYEHNATPPPPPAAAATTYQHNAWEESNKVLDERYSTPQQPQNAYQYSGTPYGNSSFTPRTETPVPAATEATNSNNFNSTKETNDVDNKRSGYRPSRLRILLRIIVLIASVGYLGFAAGASPYSGEDIPFDSTACFYFLYAVGAFSFAYSLFHVIFYFVRWFGTSGKMKRPLLILFDLFMCFMWGIGIIVEISQYRCSPGGYHHWCDFYNTSIFFGFLSFVVYIVTFGWDIFGACKSSRK